MDMVRVGALAARQAGMVARHQFACLDLSLAQVRTWIARGYLSRVLPGVYAVGHRAPVWAQLEREGAGVAQDVLRELARC